MSWNDVFFSERAEVVGHTGNPLYMLLEFGCQGGIEGS